MKAHLLAIFLFAAVLPSAFAQHDHGAMEHKLAAQAKLEVRVDAARHLLTVRLGPLELPAKSDHMAVAQPAPQFLEIPFDGWITAYHPQLVDAHGNRLPNRLLHHVAFWNTGRSDFLCPNKEEHIFGAGGEMNDWPALPGVGYRVSWRDRIRITSMFHNPMEASYPEAFLQVVLEFAQKGDSMLKSVYPAWFDAGECGNSGYDLPAGTSSKTGEFRLNYTGTLLGVGGHLHDYGRRVVLENTSRKESVATLDARLSRGGHVLEMPRAQFERGYALKKDEVMKVTASYENPGPAIPQGAMGIVVGYFIPEKDKGMADLCRPLINEVGAYRAGCGVTPPRLTGQTDPEYSEPARQVHLQGTVVLRLAVDEQGHPRDIRVMRSIGLGLDENAVEAVRKWRFKPGLFQGKPVPVELAVEVNFCLDYPCSEQLARPK